MWVRVGVRDINRWAISFLSAVWYVGQLPGGGCSESIKNGSGVLRPVTSTYLYEARFL